MFCPECGREITTNIERFNFGIQNGENYICEYICDNCNIKISVFEDTLSEYENSEKYLDMN